MFRLSLLLFVTILIVPVFAQKVTLTDREHQIDFNSLTEEAFVQTDKSVYVSGEVLWFKIFVLNTSSHHLQGISRTAYVELLTPEGGPVLQAKVSLDSGAGSGSFYLPANLESGALVLRVYTAWMKNNPKSFFEKLVTVINTRKVFDTSKSASWFAVRQFSEKPATDMNLRQQGPVQLSIPQSVFKTRTPVTIQLKNSDAASVFNLSASVYRVSELNNTKNDFTIVDFIASLRKKLNPTAVPSDTNFSLPAEVKFLPELDGMIVTVVAKKKGTHTPAAYVPVYLSVRGKVANLQVSKTNTEGIVYFNLHELYGPTQLVVQTDPEYRDNIEFTIEKSFSIQSVFLPVRRIENQSQGNPETALEELHNQSLLVNTYFGSELDSFSIPNPDSTAFFGKPFRTYLLDNYKRFVTMEEVLREYVQEVNVRIRNKDYYFQTFNRQFYDLGRYMTLDYLMTRSDPLILLDGVPVFDNNKIIKYNPLLVQKLEVVADRFHIGTKSWEGVMSFTTYKGELENFKLDPLDVVVDYEGWQRQRHFYAPDYSTPAVKNNRIPDFRNVLYWNPDIQLASSATMQFYTGDLTGKFVVVVEGISASGVPVFQTQEFEVAR